MNVHTTVTASTVRRLTGAGVGLALAAGALAAVPASSSAAGAPAADRAAPDRAVAVQRSASATVAGGLTPADLRAVAATARAAGDTQGADAAEQLADRLEGPSTQSPWVTLAKKAIQAVLRHGGSKLPGRFGQYADKMDRAIGKVDDLEEVALTAAFQQVGMPAHIATDAAKWCATFLI